MYRTSVIRASKVKIWTLDILVEQFGGRAGFYFVGHCKASIRYWSIHAENTFCHTTVSSSDKSLYKEDICCGS